MCNIMCEDCPFDVLRDPTGIHEIHITVRATPNDFRDICDANQIKSVLIEFQRTDGDTESHVMTSQRVKGSREDAMYEMDRIMSVFRDAGVPVIRRKIESGGDRINGEPGYFETHMAFDVDSNRISEPMFRRMLSAIPYDLRVSRNAFKRIDETRQTWMVTYRGSHATRADFMTDLADIERKLHDVYGMIPEKTIVEFAWLDDNIDLDTSWLIV